MFRALDCVTEQARTKCFQNMALMSETGVMGLETLLSMPEVTTVAYRPRDCCELAVTSFWASLTGTQGSFRGCAVLLDAYTTSPTTRLMS